MVSASRMIVFGSRKMLLNHCLKSLKQLSSMIALFYVAGGIFFWTFEYWGKILIKCVWIVPSLTYYALMGLMPLCTLIVYNALISAPQVIVWRILHLNGFIMFYGSLIWLLYWVFTNLYINKIYVPPLAISVVDPFVTEVHLAFLVQLYLRWLS